MIEILKNLKGKSVAVTGASGYIGSALVEALMEHSAKVLRVSRTRLAPKSGVADLQSDICTFDCWHEIVNQADVIFHLAGNTSVRVAAEDPVESLRTTVLPINHLVAAAQKSTSCPRVIFSSTATVYGLTDELPVSETQGCKPITLYDIHKYFAEQQLSLASRQTILQSVSLRLANVYGPSPGVSSATDRGMLNKISAMALQGQGLSLFGDGEPVRDYVYIDDVVQAFLIAGASQGFAGQVFNVATGQGSSLKDAFEIVADQVARVTGNMVEITSVPWPENIDAIERRNFIGNATAIKEALDWHAGVSLRSGITRMIDCFWQGGKEL